MNKRILLTLWGGMFALCACLGFIPEPTGFLKYLLTATAVGFFVPAFLLLRLCGKTGDRRTLQLMRNLAALSLLTTVVLLIANFLSVTGSVFLGNVLYCVLVIVSSPMICSRYWVVSLFLWAYLMLSCRKQLKKK